MTDFGNESGSTLIFVYLCLVSTVVSFTALATVIVGAILPIALQTTAHLNGSATNMDLRRERFVREFTVATGTPTPTRVEEEYKLMSTVFVLYRADQQQGGHTLGEPEDKQRDVARTMYPVYERDIKNLLREEGQTRDRTDILLTYVLVLLHATDVMADFTKVVHDMVWQENIDCFLVNSLGTLIDFMVKGSFAIKALVEVPVILLIFTFSSDNQSEEAKKMLKTVRPCVLLVVFIRFACCVCGVYFWVVGYNGTTCSDRATDIDPNTDRRD